MQSGPTRRGLLQSAAAVMAVPSVVPGRIPDVVNIYYYPESKPLMIAKGLGWLQDSAKAKLNWMEAGSGADMIAAIAAGTADIAFGIGCGPASVGLNQGVPCRVIAIADTVGEGEDLVVRKAAKIAKLADLKGKRIAAPFGSTSHFRLLGLLKVLEWAPGDVVLVDLKPEPMVSAWQRGDIDAGYVWNPARSRLIAAGGEPLESFREIDAAGYILADLIIARGLFVDQYPDAITGLLKAYGRALDMLKAKPAESAELIAKQVAATIDVVQADLGDCDFPPLKQQLMPAWLGTPGKVGKFSSVLKRWADFEVDQQLLRSEAPAFDKFIDTSVLQKAV